MYVKIGVKQDCNTSGLLFSSVIDGIIGKTIGDGDNRIRWKFPSKLDDLGFADDKALISSTRETDSEYDSR